MAIIKAVFGTAVNKLSISACSIGNACWQFVVGLWIAVTMVPAWATFSYYPTGTALEYDGGAGPTAATKGKLTNMTDESGVVTTATTAWAA